MRRGTRGSRLLSPRETETSSTGSRLRGHSSTRSGTPASTRPAQASCTRCATSTRRKRTRTPSSIPGWRSRRRRSARSRCSSSSSSSGAAAREATGTRSASSTPVSARSCEGELRLPLAVSRELGRLSDRSAAGEALAHVDRRLAVYERLALEQRDDVRRAEGDDGVRVEAAQGGAAHVRIRTPDDRELARRGQVEVERAERPAEGLRGARKEVADESKRADCLPLEPVVAPDPRKP